VDEDSERDRRVSNWNAHLSEQTTMAKWLHRPLAFYDQDASVAYWVRHMLAAFGGVKDVANFQHSLVLNTIEPILHKNTPIHDGKDFFAVIDVPFVWLVSPMQPHSDAVYLRNR
jgi:hypothetical protein